MFYFTADGNTSAIKVEMTRIPMYFTGSGDLFTAMILVWLHRHPDNLQVSVQYYTSFYSLQHLLHLVC